MYVIKVLPQDFNGCNCDVLGLLLASRDVIIACSTVNCLPVPLCESAACCELGNYSRFPAAAVAAPTTTTIAMLGFLRVNLEIISILGVLLLLLLLIQKSRNN